MVCHCECVSYSISVARFFIIVISCKFPSILHQKREKRHCDTLQLARNDIIQRDLPQMWNSNAYCSSYQSLIYYCSPASPINASTEHGCRCKARVVIAKLYHYPAYLTSLSSRPLNHSRVRNKGLIGESSLETWTLNFQNWMTT